MGESTYGTGDCCERQSPWTVLLGGPAGEDDVGLAFTPNFPAGVELNAVGVPTTPLRTLARWSGTIGQRWNPQTCQWDCAPGSRAIITGSVAAAFRSVVAGAVQFLTPPLDGGPAAAPRVKLQWAGCAGLPPVIFDSDSVLVVPAGPCTIDVLGPAPWAVMGRLSTATPVTWWDVVLKVLACPLEGCWCPEGELTEWLPVDIEGGIVALRELVRPRRARRLAACFVNAPGGVIAGLVEWRHFPGGPAIGATTFAATSQQTADPFGAAPYLSVTPAATGTAYLRWGLR